MSNKLKPRHIPEPKGHIDESSTIHSAAKTIFMDHHFGKTPSGMDYWIGNTSFVALDSRYPSLEGQPMVAYAYSEPWACAKSRLTGQTVASLFGVNSSQFHRMTLEAWKRGSRLPVVEGLKIPVLDVDRDKVDDPSVPGREFTAGLTKSAQSQLEADELGSWVFHSHDRDRINEYAPRQRDLAHLEKYGRLREAPFQRSDIPDSIARDRGLHNYAFVKSEAQMTDQELGERRSGGFRWYAPEDLEWLEEHMHAQDIPIPEIEG